MICVPSTVEISPIIARKSWDFRTLKNLAEYTAESERLAREAISSTLAGLKSRGYEIIAVALLFSAGRKLPPLPQILASHPLIHAAEGELFCQTIRRSCESLAIPVFG